MVVFAIVRKVLVAFVCAQEQRDLLLTLLCNSGPSQVHLDQNDLRKVKSIEGNVKAI